MKWTLAPIPFSRSCWINSDRSISSRSNFNRSAYRCQEWRQDGLRVGQLYLVEIPQELVVESSLSVSGFNEMFLLAQLMNANSRLNVTEIVLESTLDNLVVPIALFRIAVPRVFADTMQTQDTHLFEQSFLMGGHHPTFSGCQILRGIEAEDDGIAESPACRIPSTDRESPVVRANRVGGILHNRQTAFAGQFPDRFHIAS